ncbi:MAG: nicotinamide-nucleotide amidohydrolase family protein, partial [Sphingobacteriales bacterium]
EMKGIMEDHVIPFLRQNFRRESICHRTIMTAGLGESFIAERIMSLEENLPSHIKLAYLPNNWMVRLRLTGRGDDEIRLIKEVERYAGELAEMLQDIVVAMEDLSLEHLIGKQLATQEKTLGLAESCTGGHIAHKITQVMGSAKYFNGSIVSYQNETKKKLVNVDGQLLEEKGAVSEEVAAAMARGARKNLNADFGLGITGLLSPGGDDGDVPVGTVWMGVCDADTVKTKKIHVPYDRLKNKEIATDMALLLLWKFINKKV